MHVAHVPTGAPRDLACTLGLRIETPKPIVTADPPDARRFFCQTRQLRGGQTLARIPHPRRQHCVLLAWITPQLNQTLIA
ncbi:MAG: hypothetical protein BWZ07_02955 [Alphaproteobacteria bacterium ADurb.BinA280]|nr:MAG: hypothetical protein BWZ07_02955 [Alphaproteobacteria bacterium ADurb.BinA280]